MLIRYIYIYLLYIKHKKQSKISHPCFFLHIQEPKGRIQKLVETNALTVSDSGETDQISF